MPREPLEPQPLTMPTGECVVGKGGEKGLLGTLGRWTSPGLTRCLGDMNCGGVTPGLPIGELLWLMAWLLFWGPAWPWLKATFVPIWLPGEHPKVAWLGAVLLLPPLPPPCRLDPGGWPAALAVSMLPLAGGRGEGRAMPCPGEMLGFSEGLTRGRGIPELVFS